MNVSMHEYICSHTHTDTHIHTHACLKLIFIAIQGMWHLHVLKQHAVCAGLQIHVQVVVTINGWGIYNNRRDQTLPKGGVSPRKVPPLSHTSYWMDSAVTEFRAVTLGAAWDVGMACNVFKLLELLWPHPPDVVHIQCMVLDRAGIYHSHPLVYP